MNYVWAALIAVVVGFIGSYAGIAGAPFIIFAFVTFLGYTQYQAQGTVLAMMLGPMTLLPVYYGRHIVRKHIKVITISIVTYMFFSYLGAELAYAFGSYALKLVFGVVIAIIGATYFIFSVKQSDDAPVESYAESLTAKTMSIVGSIMGFIGGTVGIGSGILLVPYLTMAKRIDQHEAQTISLAILMPPVSLGAVLKYGVMERDIIWPVVGVIFFAYLLAGGFGYRLSARHGARALRTVLALLLVATGIVNIVMSI